MILFSRLTCAAAAALLLSAATSARAWEASVIDSPDLPSQLVVVEKQNRRLFFMEKQSPLTIRDQFASIHGQKEGDKQNEGDLRTPEGVYFVTGPITQSLDFLEYGSQAHGLNYPNPVDRLRGKTGSGIWIHSKGEPIMNARYTKGCIAVDLADIDVLGPKLAPGTPVVVAETVVTDARGAAPGATTLRSIGTDFVADPAASSVEQDPLSDSRGNVPPRGNKPEGPVSNTGVERLIVDQTRQWNKAWAGRSAAMFDFYDADSYTKAQGESFAAFRAQKERLFKMLPWINIITGDVQVLQGPDYWVSWFKQYYRAPNLSTEGIRRLYWQPAKNGEIKIVGMEWIPTDVGLERDYLESLAPSVVLFVEQWRKAWEKGDMQAYRGFYSKNAVQDGTRGDEIFNRKTRIWASKKPTSVSFYGTRVRLEENGVRVDMTQVYRDSTGYQDKGVKELLLYPEGDSWRIVSETWSRA